MFINMDIQWAGTFLGCVALIMVPVPLLFIKYGPTLRAKSKWVPKLPPPPSAAPKTDEEVTEKEVDKSESSGGSEKHA